MIISTIITRNKKPAQATYQMTNPEQPVQNELKVNSEVVLNNDEDNPQELHLKIVEPIQDVPEEKDQKLISSTEETEQTNTSVIVEEGKTETLTIQEQSSEQEPESVQETEQTNTSVIVEEGKTETLTIQEQEQSSEQEPVQESEQPQIEKVEETPKKKASSKKK